MAIFLMVPRLLVQRFYGAMGGATVALLMVTSAQTANYEDGITVTELI